MPLLPFWTFVACSRVTFTFTFTLVRPKSLLLVDGARQNFPRLLDADLSRRFEFCPFAIRGRESSVFSLSQEFSEQYIYRTAQLASRRCILNIYSTNIPTEYFKHAAHSPFLSLSLSSRCRLFHNATFFGSCNIHILNSRCAKILKKIPTPKG